MAIERFSKTGAFRRRVKELYIKLGIGHVSIFFLFQIYRSFLIKNIIKADTSDEEKSFQNCLFIY